ncbi:MAG: mandelate racemase/muconate lactonizing enzyme family protein [Halobacteriales archaeon]
MAPATRDVEITGVETYVVANPWKPWVFVRVETDAGVHGIAEATTHSKSRTVVEAFEEMSEYVVGTSPFETERLALEMYRDEWYSANLINTTVISAIDTACWDIKGKLLDRPLYDLLGGAVNGTSLRAYANGWYTDAEGEPDGFAKAAERVIEDGYDALKFDPFGTAWERTDRGDRNRALECIDAVREAVGPDVDLLIEGHGRFTPGAAVELARDMESADPTWFEEPCPPDNIDGLRKVAERSRVPIATGERLMGAQAFSDLLRQTDVDVIQPDLVNTGGVTEGKKIAALAEADHVSFAPHNPQGPVATAVCAHVCATTPNFMIQEVFEDYDVAWKTDLLDNPVVVEDGELQVPGGPGLGIDLDLDAVEKHAFTGENAEAMNLFEAGWESRSMGDR